MNFEADDLLEMVDKWKLKLYKQLKGMTPAEEAAFWERSLEKARAMGLPIAGEPLPPPRKPKRPSTKAS